MAKKKRGSFIQSRSARLTKKPVDSLLDVMRDGNEYASLVDVAPKKLDLRPEIVRAITVQILKPSGGIHY